MKKHMTLLLLCIGIASTVWASKESIEDTRTFEKTFTVNPDALLNIEAREADITIQTWNKNTVEVKAIISVEARSEEDLENMFEILALDMTGTPSQVDLIAKICIQSKLSSKTSITETRTKIKIKTDNLQANVQSYSVQYFISMPTTNNLNIKNRYGSVELADHRATVDAELYECSLRAGALQSEKAELTLKYSDIIIASIGNASFRLYESELELGSAGILNMNTKYSDINIALADAVKLDAYEDEIKIGAIETLSGEQRYGSLSFASATQVDLQLYEVELEAATVASLTLSNSKYVNMECAAVESFRMVSGYENNVEIGTVRDIDFSGKYINMECAILTGSLKLDGYEYDIDIESVGKDFKSVSLSGKYGNADINFHPDATYDLQCKVQYGSMDFPRQHFNISIDRETDEGYEVKAVSKTSPGRAQVDISGYEVSLDLN